MGIDLLPTFCAMAGVGLRNGVKIDGRDIGSLLTRGAPSPHEALILFDNEDVVGVRSQRWKYVSADYSRSRLFSVEQRGDPQLYDMEQDPSESYSVARQHPDVLKAMRTRFSAAEETFGPLRTQENFGIFILPNPAPGLD